MAFEITVNMVRKTCCLCGGIYYVPEWMEHSSNCPMCSYRTKRELLKQHEALYRRIAALQGVITKMKKGGNCGKVHHGSD